MKLLVDFRRITLDQLEALQGNPALQRSLQPKRWYWPFRKNTAVTEMSALRGLLAQFLVEDDDKPIPYEEAVKRVGSLSLEAVMDASSQISASMREVGRAAVPPATKGS